MISAHKRLIYISILIVIFTGVLPILLYWVWNGGIPPVSANIGNIDSLMQSILEGQSTNEGWSFANAAYTTKLVYMVLSFSFILVLRKSKSLDLKALFWGMLSFFVGEFICLLNYIFFNDQSLLAEYLHSFGMVLSIGFIVFAFIEGLDKRVIKFSDPKAKCAFLSLCGNCSKYKAVPCRLNRMLILSIGLLIVIAFIPLSYLPAALANPPDTAALFYNYGDTAIHQLYEARFCPIIAIVFLLLSLFLLLKEDGKYLPEAKLFFVTGVAHLGFGLLRLSLRSIYLEDIARFTFWEEMTELIFIAGIGIILWIFQDILLKPTLEKS